jgi:hypothetical protein
MNANELADALHKIYIQEAAECWDVVDEAATMLRQQQAEIEALKKQIPDWENINKPNPFIGWEKNLVAVDPNPNSGLGGVALRKAQEK